MVVGRSCSPNGSSELDRVVKGSFVDVDAVRPTRLYFGFLGAFSVVNSLRIDWNSCSASSSRERGFVGVAVVKGSEVVWGGGTDGASCGEGNDPDSDVEDQSQPILVCLMVVRSVDVGEAEVDAFSMSEP